MARTLSTIDWATLRDQADVQAGLLSRGQCRNAGMTDRFIDHRLASRRWRRVHPGVYLTALGRDDWHVRATAVFLSVQSAGPVADAAFRGASAAYLWGLERRPPAVVDLAVPLDRRVVPPDGAVVRRVGSWDRVVDDLAYPWRTTLAATVLDVGAEGSPDRAVAVAAEAVRRELTTTAVLARELALRPRHPHRGLLREVLGDLEGGAQSAAEVRYIRDVERAHGLPAATRQAPTTSGGLRIHDNRYDAFGLIVEVDGRLGHAGWSDRIRDGQRDRQVLPTGGVTTRVFWPDVAVTVCRTAQEVGAILQSRGWGGSPRHCGRSGCVNG